MSYDSDRKRLPDNTADPRVALAFAGRTIQPSAVGYDGRHVDWAPGIGHAAYLARQDVARRSVLHPDSSFAAGTADYALLDEEGPWPTTKA